MQEIERQRPVVRGFKDRDRPSSNSGVIATVGSGEIQDRWIGEQGPFDEKEARDKVTTVRSHWRVRSTDRRHCGEPSCMGIIS
jgi:hypothetical protein